MGCGVAREVSMEVEQKRQFQRAVVKWQLAVRIGFYVPRDYNRYVNLSEVDQLAMHRKSFSNFIYWHSLTYKVCIET